HEVELALAGGAARAAVELHQDPLALERRIGRQRNLPGCQEGAVVARLAADEVELPDERARDDRQREEGGQQRELHASAPDGFRIVFFHGSDSAQEAGRRTARQGSTTVTHSSRAY